MGESSSALSVKYNDKVIGKAKVSWVQNRVPAVLDGDWPWKVYEPHTEGMHASNLLVIADSADRLGVYPRMTPTLKLITIDHGVSVCSGESDRGRSGAIILKHEWG